MSNEIDVTVTSKDRTDFDAPTKSAKNYGDAIEGVGEKADTSEARILGAKDAVDGVATIMQGPGQQGMAAYLQGWADLASGIANFIIPAVKAVATTGLQTVATIAHTAASKAAAIGTKAWAATQWVLNAALTANPIGIVVVAIAALVAAIVIAWKRSETFRTVVTGAFAAVKTAVTGVVNFFKSLPGWISRAVGNVSGLLTQKGRDIIGGLIAGFGRVVDVATWLAKLPGRILVWIGRAELWLIGKGKNAIGGLLSGIGTKALDLAGWFGKLGLRVLTWVGRAELWLIQKGKNVLGGFLRGLGEKWKDVTEWVAGIATWIKEHKGPVSLDGELLVPAGRAIMSGFLKGLQSGAGKAWSFVKSVGGKTVDQLGAALGFVAGGFTGGTGSNIDIGRGMAAAYGWTGDQWRALFSLWTKESNWNNLAKNPTSTAFGIPQFLNSTAAAYGVLGDTDPRHQIAAGLRYIRDAYGSPLNAWQKWLSRSPHWYGKGGLITEPIMGVGRSGQIYGFGENGVETVTAGHGAAAGGINLTLNVNPSARGLDRVFTSWLIEALRTNPGVVATIKTILGP